MFKDLPGYRIWGKPPFTLVLLHGGPGAAGSVASLASVLGKQFGVVEPFQKGITIQAQVEELAEVITQNAQQPVVLIGHSWGAWLGFIFASVHPEMVHKLIMIGTPPVEEKFASMIRKIREDRISKPEKEQLEIITGGMETNSKESFRKMGELISKIDSFDLLPIEDKVDFRPDIYSSIWKEAGELRKDNKLLGFTSLIKCPVITFHGDYDPHPWMGVKIPLEERIPEFKFILLEKCGHYPWKERFARELFFERLIQEITFMNEN